MNIQAPTTIEGLLTVQDIERSLPGIKAHQIRYALRTRNIEPLGWLGHARVYGQDVIGRLQQAFDEMNTASEKA